MQTIELRASADISNAYSAKVHIHRTLLVRFPDLPHHPFPGEYASALLQMLQAGVDQHDFPALVELEGPYRAQMTANIHAAWRFGILVLSDQFIAHHQGTAEAQHTAASTEATAHAAVRSMMKAPLVFASPNADLTALRREATQRLLAFLGECIDDAWSEDSDCLPHRRKAVRPRGALTLVPSIGDVQKTQR